jgi:hypothetical protein
MKAYESAGVFDVNGDGHLDIVSGGFWYQGSAVPASVTSSATFPATANTTTIFRPLPSTSTAPVPSIMSLAAGGAIVCAGANAPPTPPNPGGHHPRRQYRQRRNHPRLGYRWQRRHRNRPQHATQPDVNYYKLIMDSNGKGTRNRSKKLPSTLLPRAPKGMAWAVVISPAMAAWTYVLCNGWLEAPADPAHGEWRWHPDSPTPPWGTTAEYPDARRQCRW